MVCFPAMSSLNALGVLYENTYFPKPVCNSTISKKKKKKRLNFIVPNMLVSSTISLYNIVKQIHTNTHPLGMHFVGFYFSFYTRENKSMAALFTANKTCLGKTNLAIYALHLFIHSFTYRTTSCAKQLLKNSNREKAPFTHPVSPHCMGIRPGKFNH